MQKQKRWIKSVIETAAREDTRLPWQRGTRRMISVARRQPAAPKVNSA